MKIGKIILLSLLLLLIGHPAFGQPITLVTLGDSLTEGDGDDGIGGGYPARLLSMLQSLYPGSTLNNLGISGDISDALIDKQLEPAVNLLNAAPAGNLKIALIWIGSNDLFGLYNYVCDEYYGNNYSACEGATFGYYSDNITTILTSLKATGSQIYIALLDDQSRRPVMTDPVLRVESFPLITDVDVSRMSTQVSTYNDEIARLASTKGATTVDFFSTTIFENWATLSGDGNHPNGVGYDAIATIWYQAITSSSTPTIPTVTTTATSSVTTTSASSGGNITSDGGASVTARGVCWSTSANPTTANSKTTDGTGTDSFTSLITGLSSGTPYHVRAYATNSQGTSYGSDVTFTTSTIAPTVFSHVSSDGNCGTKDPCYSKIQDAVNNAPDGTEIWVKQGTYKESISLISAKTVTVKGGYDSAYTGQTANTTFIQGIGQTTIQASGGSLKFQMLSIRSQPGDTWTDPVTGMVFEWVAGGCYEMGCGSWTDSCGSDESPVHEVCVDGFWIGKYEVTQGHWEQIMGSNPSYNKAGDDFPVEQVSWNDCQDFITALNGKGSNTFRLSTEAEWEYAARGGGKEEKYAGGNDLNSLGWYLDNSESHSHEVGTKTANSLGIFDMSGNVWEWCSDWYASDYYSDSPVNNPQGPTTGSYRVIRGGGWNSNAQACRAAARSSSYPDNRDDNVGFRLVRQQ